MPHFSSESLDFITHFSQWTGIFFIPLSKKKEDGSPVGHKRLKSSVVVKSVSSKFLAQETEHVIITW